MTGPSTRVIDLKGRVVIPGINDAHVHALWDTPGRRVKLKPDASLSEVVQSVREAVAEGPGQAVVGELPIALHDEPKATRQALDGVAPQHPVILTDLGGHAALLNSAALAAWKIGDNDPDPQGGWYGRDRDGRLNGWVYEHALWSKQRGAVRALAASELTAAFRQFSNEVLRYGITSVQNMSALLVREAVELAEKADLPIRWRMIRMQMGEVATLSPVGQRPGPEAMVRQSGVKYILDGTPLERGAAMLIDYRDRAGHTGRLNYTAADVRKMLAEARKSGEPLLIHAVGDRAIDLVLAEMEAMPGDEPWPQLRVRIEHGDLFAGNLLERARRLGIVVVQNPSHFAFPRIMISRWGSERNPQPLRSLAARGIPVAIGSDGPINPFLNILFATTHPTNPGEALTREQAVIAYTRGSAYAEFAEQEKGSLAPGMLADLAVLSQDIFTVASEKLPGTESVLTMVGGKIVHEAAK